MSRWPSPFASMTDINPLPVSTVSEPSTSTTGGAGSGAVPPCTGPDGPGADGGTGSAGAGGGPGAGSTTGGAVHLAHSDSSEP